MAKSPPDRRFDDSPFSGMPSRRVSRRPSQNPSDDDRSPRSAEPLFSPPPPRRRPSPPRPDESSRRDQPRRTREFDAVRAAADPNSRFREDRRAAPPSKRRPPGDGYGDTHADLRWDTDRRLRPAYREGRDYLSPRDAEGTDREWPVRDGTGHGGRRPDRRDPFADPLRPSMARRDRDGRGDRIRVERPDDAAGRVGDRRGQGFPTLPDHDRDGLEDDPPTGARMVGTGGGPGGRMLAIAGVLFLAVSVVVASIGSMLNGDDDAGAGNGTEIAGVTVASGSVADLTAPVDGTANTDEPLIRFADQPQPTSTLPPAGQQEPGFAGPWLDGIRTICIDPGHGGSDRGRTFAGDGDIPPLEEAVYTLQIAELLRDRLGAKGYVVVMTRTEDKDVNVDGGDLNGDGRTIADSDRDGTYDEIQARINICNRSNADLMISVHLNGYDTGKPSGFESWYTADRPFGPQSSVFAQLGVESIGKHFAAEGYTPENRGAKDDGTYTVDDSDPTLAHNMLLTGPAIPGMLVPSKMPSAIMESLFITNLDDIAFLRSANGTSVIADAFVDAIDGYFSRFAF
jgi:N-acetylmuramoyl-L-alanine amidase